MTSQYSLTQLKFGAEELLQELGTGFEITGVSLKLDDKDFTSNLAFDEIDNSWSLRIPGGYSSSSFTYYVTNKENGSTEVFTIESSISDGYAAAFDALVESNPLFKEATNRDSILPFDENNIARLTGDNTKGAPNAFRSGFVALIDDPKIGTVDIQAAGINPQYTDDLSELGNTAIYRIVGNPYDGGYLELANAVENEPTRIDIPTRPENTSSSEYSYQYEFVTVFPPGEAIDLLTGFNVAAGENFSATYFLDLNSDIEADDRIGYKGSDNENTYFVVKDAVADVLISPNSITRVESEYSLILVENGFNAADALESGKYLMSGSFMAESGKRDFVSFDNTAINAFKSSNDAEQNYVAILYNIDTGEELLTKSIGNLDKSTSDAFSVRYNRLFSEAEDIVSIDGIDTTSFI